MPLRPKIQRAWGILAGLVVLGGGLWGVFQAFESHLVFYYTPRELLQKTFPKNQKVRLGGVVERQSFVRHGESCSFHITDGFASIDVRYTGTLPRLFQEGQEAVVEGFLKPQEAIFQAMLVLVKHDEVYAPSSCKESSPQ